MLPKDQLLNKEMDLNKKYQELDHLPPILFAAKYGLVDYITSTFSNLSQEKIKELICATNAGGLTPLHFACKYGQVEAAECLLNLGAPTSVASSLGYLPIHMIFSNKNHMDTIERLFLLLSVKGGLEEKTSSNENIAHLAASMGMTNILKYLRTHASKLLNAKDNQSLTPLLIAVINAQIEAAHYLLENSDISLTNSKGQNALHVAAQSSSTKMLVTLLPYFECNLIDNERNTALDLAKKKRDEGNVSAILNFNSKPFYQKI